MKNLILLINKFLFPFFNTRAASVYVLLFAFSIGVATFIENDFGTSAAQKIVYKSWWFTTLLTLFGIAIIVNIFKFRMIQQKKWALAMFHAAIIIILLGAGITRYFGYDGIMHIRENQTSNSFLSSDNYLKFRVDKNNAMYEFDEPVLFASLGKNHWTESYLIGDDLIEVSLKEFIPNPVQKIETNSNGKPIINIVFAGSSGREEYFISEGESIKIHDVLFNFNQNQISKAINLSYRNDSVLIKADRVLTQMTMATQKRDTLYPVNGFQVLKLRSLYSDGQNNFVFAAFNNSGIAQIESESLKIKRESTTALKLEVKVNGFAQDMYVYGNKGLYGIPSIKNFKNLRLSISYGAKIHSLPFSIKLHDFILDRYPGTKNPVSYASEVQLIDSRTNLALDYRIYMNNILDYGGHRFFQSSYDNDEQGTYLSVNYDFWGTWVSYLGYFLLTLGMILSLMSKKSRFYQLSKKMKALRAKSSSSLFVTVLLICSSGTFSYSQKTIGQGNSTNIVNEQHALKFSNLVVQDSRGRMKPMHTLSREIMRKLIRKETIDGLSADQIILGMFANNQDWYGVPIIKLGKHEAINTLLGVSNSRASYKDFFAKNGSYKLSNEVNIAYNMQPTERAVYEKELMKIDERVNIVNMIFNGSFFKIIPIPNDANNTWVSNHAHNQTTNLVADNFFRDYAPALREAMSTNDYTYANKLIDELAAYQQSAGKAVIPSPTKISAEIFLNNLNVFNRLAVFYVLLGVAFLSLVFLQVFKPKLKLKRVYQILLGLMVLSFVFHTIGLGLRWYVSGRAPWSNSYESMIYIAWTTVLAGVLFTKKIIGGLAATMVLSATVLLVASITNLDPEITPLVPVLKSYWLTIHVSLEAGSYGFLMLGAVIGLLNLILILFITDKNKTETQRMVKELSFLSEMILIGGLFMVSTGTYLGGIWANESWGRYWGWDAKETWALVTILVYAFILHMRLIPKLKGLFAYNFASIFGFASVIMTYYGVNYYLSGLHSYATGDPIPIPQWVYIFILTIAIISGLAFRKSPKLRL